MWDVFLCDGNREALNSLRIGLEQCAGSYISSVTCFSSPEQLLFGVCENPEKANILFIDIELGGKQDGIELAKKVKSINPEIQIVFVSGQTKYAEAVYSVEHAYYLVKPFDSARLKKALLLAGERIGEERRKIIKVVKRDAIYKIFQRDIFYVERKSPNITIFTETDRFTTGSRMDELEAELGAPFFRCHTSYIVNLRKVKALENNCFVLENGETVYISRNYSAAAKKSFLEYLSSLRQAPIK